jgi:hypothetical protein
MSELRLFNHYHMDADGTSICAVPSKASIEAALDKVDPRHDHLLPAASHFRHLPIPRSL